MDETLCVIVQDPDNDRKVRVVEQDSGKIVATGYLRVTGFVTTIVGEQVSLSAVVGQQVSLSAAVQFEGVTVDE